MLVKESGISPEVVEQRGYRTVRDLDELREYGFSPRAFWRRSAGSDKGLLIPLHLPASAPSPTPLPALYRPDMPPTDPATRRPIRYTSPRRARNYIDVHPAMQAKLQDPSVGVLITEGHKKADAATSRGLVCLGLSGVDNFRYRLRDEYGERGSSVPCDEWKYIPMRRNFTIVFDSDQAVNKKVHEARGRLTRFLADHGAQVFWVNLPAGREGAKVGLDDYFAAGQTADDLRGLWVPADGCAS
jgi:hypothetical protein